MAELPEYVVLRKKNETKTEVEWELVDSADVAPVRHGRWKGEHKCGSFSHPDSITYECSECGYSVYTIYGLPPITNYCPKCGARMGVTE